VLRGIIQINVTSDVVGNENVCNDDIDNDLDTYTDCLDSDCDGISSCEYSTESTCDDSFDNDADGDTDCNDSDCYAAPGCPAAENLYDSWCADSLDNDLDGSTDCDDSDCIGIIGAEGYACAFNETGYCEDDADNDGDGLTDCDDSDCTGTGGNCYPCPSVENLTLDSCADSLDNDGDTYTDCEDIDCNGFMGPDFQTCEYSNESTCDDSFDNDGDTYTDCLDPDCSCFADELSAGQCRDGIDNDFDGDTDCDDSDCSNKVYCISCETAYPSICSSSLGDIQLSYPDILRDTNNLSVTFTKSNLTSAHILFALGSSNNSISQLGTLSDANTFLTYSGNTAISKQYGTHAIQGEHTSYTGDLNLTLSFQMDNTATGTYSIGILSYIDGVVDESIITVYVMEDTAPDATIHPSNSSTLYSQNITVNVSATDSSGIDYCEISIDGSAYSNNVNCSTTQAFTEGTHSASIRVYDGAGNYVTKSTTFTVSLPPLQYANYTLPSTSYFNSSQTMGVSVNFTSSYFGASQYCSFLVDGVEIDGNSTSPTVCEDSISLSTLSNGSHYLSTSINDSRSITGYSNNRQFWLCEYNHWSDSNRCLDVCERTRVSTTTITNPSSNSDIMSSAQFSVNATVASANGRLQNCQSTIYFYPNDLDTVGSRAKSLGNFEIDEEKTTSWTVEALEDGTYNITVRTSCTGGASSSDTIYNISIYMPRSKTTITYPPQGTTFDHNDVFTLVSKIEALTGSVRGCTSTLTSGSSTIRIPVVSQSVGNLSGSEYMTLNWTVGAIKEGRYTLLVNTTCDFGTSSNDDVVINVRPSPIVACGNGVCGDDESTLTCPQDCLSVSCGDGVCEEGENVINCFRDCFVKPRLPGIRVTVPPQMDSLTNTTGMFDVRVENTGETDLDNVLLKISWPSMDFHISPSKFDSIPESESRVFVVSYTAHEEGIFNVTIEIQSNQITDKKVTIFNITTIPEVVIVPEENITTHVTETVVTRIVATRQKQELDDVIAGIEDEILEMQENGYDVSTIMPNFQRVVEGTKAVGDNYEKGEYTSSIDIMNQIRSSLHDVAEESALLKKTYRAVLLYLILLMPLPIILTIFVLLYIVRFKEED